MQLEEALGKVTAELKERTRQLESISAQVLCVFSLWIGVSTRSMLCLLVFAGR
jgi:hypothetical protein